VQQPFSSVLLSLAKGCVADALASWLGGYAWQGMAAAWGRSIPFSGVRLCLVYIGSDQLGDSCGGISVMIATPSCRESVLIFIRVFVDISISYISNNRLL
jgi:hypothetical protein